jgi:hypothetical protein
LERGQENKKHEEKWDMKKKHQLHNRDYGGTVPFIWVDHKGFPEEAISKSQSNEMR